MTGKKKKRVEKDWRSGRCELRRNRGESMQICEGRKEDIGALR